MVHHTIAYPGQAGLFDNYSDDGVSAAIGVQHTMQWQILGRNGDLVTFLTVTVMMVVIADIGVQHTSGKSGGVLMTLFDSFCDARNIILRAMETLKSDMYSNNYIFLFRNSTVASFWSLKIHTRLTQRVTQFMAGWKICLKFFHLDCNAIFIIEES